MELVGGHASVQATECCGFCRCSVHRGLVLVVRTGRPQRTGWQITAWLAFYSRGLAFCLEKTYTHGLQAESHSIVSMIIYQSYGWCHGFSTGSCERFDREELVQPCIISELFVLPCADVSASSSAQTHLLALLPFTPAGTLVAIMLRTYVGLDRVLAYVCTGWSEHRSRLSGC